MATSAGLLQRGEDLDELNSDPRMGETIGRLEEEQNQSRQQPREQEQIVELPRAEQLHKEHEATLASLEEATPTAKLHVEIPARRRRDKGEPIPGRKVMHIPPRPAPEKTHVDSLPTLTKPRSSAANWYLSFIDSAGQSHNTSGSVDEIQQWVREGRIEVARTRISRDTGGPFGPLKHFLEAVQSCEAPILPSAALTMAAEKARAIPTRAESVSTPAQRDPDPEGSKSAEWVSWAIPTLLALVAAIIAGQFLFH